MNSSVHTCMHSFMDSSYSSRYRSAASQRLQVVLRELLLQSLDYVTLEFGKLSLSSELHFGSMQRSLSISTWRGADREKYSLSLLSHHFLQRRVAVAAQLQSMLKALPKRLLRLVHICGAYSSSRSQSTIQYHTNSTYINSNTLICTVKTHKNSIALSCVLYACCLLCLFATLHGVSKVCTCTVAHAIKLSTAALHPSQAGCVPKLNNSCASTGRTQQRYALLALLLTVL
jgi:hypothetical protein